MGRRYGQFTEWGRESMKSAKPSSNKYGLMKTDLGTKESQYRATEMATGIKRRK